MALRTVLVSDVPSLPDSVYGLSEGLELSKPTSFRLPGFSVIGHRGIGMNVLQSSDRRARGVKENSILSFNSAAKYPIDFIEFDVQVTKDDCPVIFHDDFIYSEENGIVNESRVTDLSLSEFLLYGPQKETEKIGKTLMRKSKEGKVLKWDVDLDDSLCTLQEAFEQVEQTLGFNIELKFDDQTVYEREFLVHILRSVLQVVSNYAKDRPVIFSSFQPDAAKLVRELQSTYPVFFLTDAGNEIHNDERRNSLEEAIQVCLEGGLQGIVSEVKGVFRNPAAISKIKESNLSLLTYGKLNNVGEAVYMQYVMGIDGVIVDFVEEIIESTTRMMIRPPPSSSPLPSPSKDDDVAITRPEFSQKEISFLLKLLSQLIQH
ncbi:Glycerophosphodiester phosphodiesterase GDPD2 [Arabidopsis thaliana]|uniref:Glycerophosphodiester phosphodiesterase GDPD2 n=5 Tax=Arabidopsis TaxID=3701 RepID=GDPD2_ARATH|nr:PLC-like phosphodiesterases superfamily protein [Arabidopsis thaliana]Q9FLM1.1 RecName: Full=Glycerophosphodiester phosphodiesterase GDPD2; AltName: Full=Glycerophosphodiester phosphodiesterase 2; Short=AtGDPD2 [Arabidopsis thaliana]KAG7604484.1 Glycerophosphodiester phosphodiesterase domain [Arabidopsis thaliana x Arabidopsis arenosa]KAG7611412.1 Glycerophosphodiester phosphodiesterase domain [Arabidopsis suecica]ABN04759.1 At5g41080 [Arabidopsis thaliana]AED94635.1 PLC-like phosphodiester|eukprot:NP_198924.1 PLC-like phosphodiesterases superfamily protein [Arabidopsis thaliana]